MYFSLHMSEDVKLSSDELGPRGDWGPEKEVASVACGIDGRLQASVWQVCIIINYSQISLASLQEYHMIAKAAMADRVQTCLS